MITLISFATFVTNSSLCQDKICTVAKLDTVLIASNFSNWAATTTYLGIQISKRGSKGVGRVLRREKFGFRPLFGHVLCPDKL